MFGFKGKTVVITGGAGVLAGSIAHSFLSAGASVSLWGRNQNNLQSALEQITADRADWVDRIDLKTVDCLSKTQVEEALGLLEAQGVMPQVLINGVGGNRGKCGFLEQDIEQFKAILDLNLIGGMLIPTQAFAKRWREVGARGNIINLASMASYKPCSGVWAYNAAKAAVMNLTQGVAAEFAEYGIRVNSISPGFFLGKQNYHLLVASDNPRMLTQRGQDVIDRTPMKRFGNYNDLKGAVLFLASDRAAEFVTGIDIPVDGGFLVDNI